MTCTWICDYKFISIISKSALFVDLLHMILTKAVKIKNKCKKNQRNFKNTF